MPGNPERFLRIRWLAPPQAGEAQYLPAFRFTVLEHYMPDVRELAGASVRWEFYTRVAGVGMLIQPIFWTNFQDGDYAIYETGVIHNPMTTWQKVSGTMVLPDFPSGKVLSPQHYIGFGIDFPGQFAPTIDFAEFNVNGQAHLEKRPLALERLLARA